MTDILLNSPTVELDVELETEMRQYPVIPNPEGEPTEDITKMGIDNVVYGVKDSGVHEWARAEEKPTYTKAEVGLGNVDNTSDLDKPISTATQTALNGKVNVEIGKGLSTNDYSDSEKTKLSGISEGAEVNVQSDFTETDITKDSYIVNNPFSVLNGEINLTFTE